MVKMIRLHKLSGQVVSLNPDWIFILDRQELQRSGHTLIVPIGGGEPVKVRETPDEIEALQKAAEELDSR